MSPVRPLALTVLVSLAGCAAGSTGSLRAPAPQQEAHGFANAEPLEGNLFTDRPSFGSGTGAVFATVGASTRF